MRHAPQAAFAQTRALATLASMDFLRVTMRGARILLYHGTPRRFATALERQLKFVRSRFEIIALPRLLELLSSSPAQVARKLALTFDDGLRNNVTVAYPLLKKLGLPATFFICPALVGSARWLWNHEARQRLRFLGDARHAERIIESMKRLDHASRLRLEEEIRKASPHYLPSAREHEDFDIAGWDDIGSLDPSLITIGSHSMTHAILTSLNESEAEREIAASRALLEERLNRSVDVFSYPNGDYGAKILDCVRRHYRAAVTVANDWVRACSDAHLLPRYSPPAGMLRLALDIRRG
jgi:peptidoglycan/xylan/chitin deacetylase (PgdA/CDA1 family)